VFYCSLFPENFRFLALSVPEICAFQHFKETISATEELASLKFPVFLALQVTAVKFGTVIEWGFSDSCQKFQQNAPTIF